MIHTFSCWYLGHVELTNLTNSVWSITILFVDDQKEGLCLSELGFELIVWKCRICKNHELFVISSKPAITYVLLYLTVILIIIWCSENYLFDNYLVVLLNTEKITVNLIAISVQLVT